MLAIKLEVWMAAITWLDVKTPKRVANIAEISTSKRFTRCGGHYSISSGMFLKLT